MKVQVYLAIIVLFVCIHYGYSAAGNQVIRKVRSTQSCASSVVGRQGWYWDGQKCEQCGSENCFCNIKQKYRSCDNCTSSYGMVSPWTKWTDFQDCIDCGQQGFRSAPLQIGTCCITWASADQTKALTLTQQSYTPRATACVSTASSKSALAGSVCWNQANCKALQLDGLCNECNPGFYMNNQQQCTACTSNCYQTLSLKGSLTGCCKTCVGANQCNTCNDGFYLATNTNKKSNNPVIRLYASMCVQCTDANCVCTEAAPGTCTGCVKKDGTMYFKETPSGTCTACTLFVANCAQCNTAALNKCLLCTQSSDIVQRSPIVGVNGADTCVDCPNYCTSCSTVQIGGVSTASCQTCYNGYFLLTTAGQANTCSPCKAVANWANVARCNSATVMTQCGKVVSNDVWPVHSAAPHTGDYYLFTDTASNGALSCLANTNSCTTMKSTAGLCTSCYTDINYALTSDFKCVLCPANCDNWLAVDSCVKNASGGGLKCTKCIDGLQNVNPTVYTQANYYADAVSGNCLKCQNGCLTCIALGTADNGKCLTCQSGFMQDLSNHAICNACGVNYCKSCTGANKTCTLCYWGYTLLSGTVPSCIQCDLNCKSCQPDSRATCLECNSGFWLNSQNACQVSVANCMTHENVTGCKICQYGFRLVKGRCYKCYSSTYGFQNCPSGCESQDVKLGKNLGFNSGSSSGGGTVTPVGPTNGTNGTTPSNGTGGVGANILMFSFIGFIMLVVNLI